MLKFTKKKRGPDGKFLKKDQLMSDLTNPYDYQRSDNDSEDISITVSLSYFEKFKNVVFFFAILWVCLITFTYVKKNKALDKAIGLYTDYFECPICQACPAPIECNYQELKKKEDPINQQSSQ
jgi:hypothetical protein